MKPVGWSDARVWLPTVHGTDALRSIHLEYGLTHEQSVVDGARLFERDGTEHSSERIVAVHGQRTEGDGRQ